MTDLKLFERAAKASEHKTLSGWVRHVPREATTRLMFQKDYWRRTDMELRAFAQKHNIPTSHNEAVKTISVGFDREYVISKLLLRDNALRTRITVILSVLALAISIASLCLTYFKRGK